MADRPPRWCAKCCAPHAGACPARPARPTDRRPESTARGYDATWESLSRMVRMHHPVCQLCCFAASTEVDHIVPLRVGGARLELSNLQAVCHQCHTWKTKGDRRRYPELKIAARVRG